MISEEVIRKILKSGILAPSGENAQPWLFKIEKNTILLFNNPDSDQSLYNYQQSGSFVAHGALIENLVIAAQGFGCELNIKYFPDSKNPDFVASIVLKESSPQKHPLEDAIRLRATNRKTYDGSPLTDAEKRELLDISPDALSFVRLVAVEDKDIITKLAKAASENEAMLVENKSVHDFFFSHVRWTLKENELQPNGFYIKTLELKPPQVGALKLIRRWKMARIMDRFGVSRKVSRENEGIYASASLMVGVVIKKAVPRDLVLAGRTLEHVWLTATKLGLSVQPTTGALFLASGVEKENAKYFSEDQRKRLLNSRKIIYEALDIDSRQEHIAVLFRIGHSDPPSARAARFPLEVFLERPLMQAERNIPKMASDRMAAINHILKDLSALKNNSSFPNQYAVDESMLFFEAIKSIPRYIRWLKQRAPKLDRERLLELTDMPFPHWDKEMHLKLIEVERRDPPGMVAPLVRRLIQLIKENDGQRFIGINLGCGGMETERQIIKRLIAEKYNRQIVFIGIDKSSMVHELARENLREVEPFIALYEIEELNESNLDQLIKTNQNRHIVVLAKNDIFDLPQQFRPSSFDVLYHTLFKHHLDENQKKLFDSSISFLGKKVLEYDGYKNWPIVIPQTIVGWNSPAFLNAEIFSNFRFLNKTELKKVASKKRLTFYPSKGTYLME